MTTSTDSQGQVKQRTKVIYKGASSAPIYGLGFLGALIYYLGHAATFWIGVLGFFKAIVWPAMLVYELMKYMNM